MGIITGMTIAKMASIYLNSPYMITLIHCKTRTCLPCSLFFSLQQKDNLAYLAVDMIACWQPSIARSQGISRHGIDLDCPESSKTYTGRFNTSRRRNIGCYFYTKHFQINFLARKLLYILIQSHWNFFLSVQLTILHQWFRLWLGAEQATSLVAYSAPSHYLSHWTSHYLNQWWLSLLMCHLASKNQCSEYDTKIALTAKQSTRFRPNAGT